MDETVAGLTELGVPIGAQRYPFCGFAETESYQIEEGKVVSEHPDRRCQAILRAVVQETRSRLSEAGRTCNPIAPAATGPANLKLSLSELLTCHGYRAATDDGLIAMIAGWWTNLSAHWGATWDWYVLRQPHGLAQWVVGILAAGALIGLGGPFWFDLYARLSSVVRITRSIGMEAKAKPAVASDAKPDPESEHTPENVEDAFNLSLKAVAKLRDYKTEMRSFALRAAMTEKQREDDRISASRRHHDADGTPVD